MGQTIPGGYYIGTDGQPHDANGNPVKKMSDRALKAAKDRAPDLTDEQKEALTRQRAAEQAALEAEEAAEKAAAEAKSAGQDVKAADKLAKEQAKAKK